MTWMNATGRPPLLLRIDARKRRNGANAALPIMANDMARHGRHRRPRETSTGAWRSSIATFCRTASPTNSYSQLGSDHSSRSNSVEVVSTLLLTLLQGHYDPLNCGLVAFSAWSSVCLAHRCLAGGRKCRRPYSPILKDPLRTSRIVLHELPRTS